MARMCRGTKTDIEPGYLSTAEPNMKAQDTCISAAVQNRHFMQSPCRVTKRRSGWACIGNPTLEQVPARPATCPSAAGVPATVCSLPQALGRDGVVCGCACVLTLLLCINKPMHGVQAWSGLARQRFSVVDVFLGAGELPRRLVFSCVCAGMVPVAPAVGAVLVCSCCTGGTRFGLMCVWYLR